MKYKILHKTWYSYSDVAPMCHNLTHLAPRTTHKQKCLAYTLAIDPAPAFLSEDVDYFGNCMEHFSIEAAHARMEIVATSEVEVAPPAFQPPDDSPTWESCRPRDAFGDADGMAERGIDLSVLQFTFPSPRVPELRQLFEYASPSFTSRRPILAALADLSARIHRDFKFDARATTVDTPLQTVLRQRRGVCQDFTHLAVGCLRAMGLATRYVSGYLRTMPPPGKPRLVGADASHAWCSCWCGTLGWVDFDTTNNCFVSDSHVTVAWGRDYGDVCPIQGVFIGGGEHSIGVSVDMAVVDS
jgi:transglutaminase-like putative cysteine protease